MERPKSVAPSQQEITAALLQQQSRVIAQQNLDKINANLEKQRQQVMKPTGEKRRKTNKGVVIAASPATANGLGCQKRAGAAKAPRAAAATRAGAAGGSSSSPATKAAL